MDLTAQEMNLFINSYETDTSGNIVRNNRIPTYIEFVKHLRYYNENSICITPEVYASLRKQFQITNDDLKQLKSLVTKLLQNKSLYRTTPSQIANPYHDTTYSTISAFKEEDDYSKYSGKFELLDQVSDAMEKYKRRMEKSVARKTDWKKQENERQLQNDIDGKQYASNVDENRFHSGEYDGRPNVDYDYYTNPQNAMMVAQRNDLNNPIQKSQITQNIDKLYNELTGVTKQQPSNYDMLQQSLPNIYSKNNPNANPSSNLPENRFMQDAITLQNGLTTKIKNPINGEKAEHGYQYLKGNPNRAMNDRLIGEASRMHNTTYVRR